MPITKTAEKKHYVDKHGGRICFLTVEQSKQKVIIQQEVQQPAVQQVQQMIEVDEKKYFHCDHEDCIKSFTRKRNHTYNTHRSDGYLPVYEECKGPLECEKCKIYCK